MIRLSRPVRRRSMNGRPGIILIIPDLLCGHAASGLVGEVWGVFCLLYTLLSQWEFMENSGRFPKGKPAVTVSRYPTLINYKCVLGLFVFP